MSTAFRLTAVSPSLALILALGTPGTAQNVIGVESMDYTGTLGGEAGGAGWQGPWMGVSFDSLMSWWPLDQSAKDAGPLGAHGMLSNGTYTQEIPGATVWSTHSLTFTTSPRTLFDLSPHASSIGSLLRGSLTCWVKTDKSNLMVIFGAANSTNGDNLQLLMQNGLVKYEVKSGVPTGPNLAGTTRIDDGLWHHLAVTVDAQPFAKVYVDGAVEISGPEGFIGHVIGVNGVWLGRSRTTAGFTRYFQGDIDDAAIWGNVLTEQDVQTLASLPPGLVTGPPSQKGPSVASGSLGTTSFPNSAFTTFGLAPEGNRLSESNGFPTLRQLRTNLNLKSNSVTYLSFLIRRTGTGAGPAEVQFTDSSNTRCRIGWDAAGFFTAGIDNMVTGPFATPGLTYFVVAKIFAKDPEPDEMFVRIYAPTDALDATEPTAWSITATPEAQNNNLTAMWIQQLAATSPTIEVDEFRFGKTWEAVTRVGYGTSCQGHTIGKSGRPAIGSSNYSVTLSGADPNQSAFLSLGNNNALWGTTLLPLDLTVIGGNGCFVLASREATIGTTTDGSGSATFNLPIPNLSSLANQTIFAQWASLAPSSPNALKLGFSDGMEILIER